MTGAGRGNGEPHETFNAAFGPLGRTTQYMLRTNRQVRPANWRLFKRMFKVQSPYVAQPSCEPVQSVL